MRLILLFSCIFILFFIRKCHSDMVYYYGWGERKNICGVFTKITSERGGRAIIINNVKAQYKIWYGQPYTGVEVVKNLRPGDKLCIIYVDEYKYFFNPVVIEINKI